MIGHKLLFKVVILGEAGVGKTSLLGNYCGKGFGCNYKATIGADFSNKDVTVNGTQISLQLWDTAGQQKYQSLAGAFYKGSHCCVIVFDLTCLKSFEHVREWKDKFFQYCQVSKEETFPVVILGNKSDLIEDRKVDIQKINQLKGLASNICYFETSAKDSSNIQEAFNKIAEEVLRNAEHEPKLVVKTVSLKKKDDQAKNCC